MVVLYIVVRRGSFYTFEWVAIAFVGNGVVAVKIECIVVDTSIAEDWYLDIPGK